MRRSLLMITLIFMLNAAQAMSNAEIKAKIVEKSIADYLATFAVCPCPYSKDKYGKDCGSNNIYTVSKGGTVYCYPADVPASAVEEYKHKR
jgi:hypothetical protein